MTPLEIAVEALEKIEDPRKVGHTERDLYTKYCCLQNVAHVALARIKEIQNGGPDPIIRSQQAEDEQYERPTKFQEQDHETRVENISDNVGRRDTEGVRIGVS